MNFQLFGKLLPSPMEAVADFDSTCVQATIATRHGIRVAYSVVYMVTMATVHAVCSV